MKTPNSGAASSRSWKAGKSGLRFALILGASGFFLGGVIALGVMPMMPRNFFAEEWINPSSSDGSRIVGEALSSAPGSSPPPARKDTSSTRAGIMPMVAPVSLRKSTADTKPSLSSSVDTRTAPGPGIGPSEPGGYRRIGFDLLSSFDFDKDGIPPSIRDLDGFRIRIQGYMLPIEFGVKGPKSFLLLVDQTGCCYGVPPELNACAYVVAKGGGETEYIPDEPIYVYGRLVVKESYEDGTLAYIYKITCDKIARVYP
ncbi:MAG: DUF3299 domain-containing protein [Candidatus Hydrogenedentota bacterium]